MEAKGDWESKELNETRSEVNEEKDERVKQDVMVMSARMKTNEEEHEKKHAQENEK